MFRLEKMRLQGLRYDLPTHEGCQKTGLYSTTIRKVELWLKENKNQLALVQSVLTMEWFKNELYYLVQS